MQDFRRCVFKVVLASALCTLLGVHGLLAQTGIAPLPSSTNAKLPSYDVVSIKPNKTGSGSVDIDVDDGKFDASNVSLKALLRYAYDLKESQLFGLPKWGESSRFDVKAKVVDPDMKVIKSLTDEQSSEMLQPVLTDRFHLKFHREMKVLPVYELVMVKGGPKFRESKIAGDQKAANGMGAGSISVHNTALSATAISMSTLASHLSSQLQRIVVDKTGLSGKYDLELAWSREDATPASDNAPPTLFTALQEQLGLHLQPAKDSIETFVIDQAELPSED